MKTIIMLAGLCLTACGASASELYAVSFDVGKQQFKTGDSIVIDQVLATSPKLGVGAKVVVRGHYQLASVTKARLGLFITHRVAAGPDPSSTSQVAPVEKANGWFELSCEIAYVGDLHVSFYPADRGESFGGVYLSSAGQNPLQEPN